MDRRVLLLDKEKYGEYFEGLILPEEREKMKEEENFLIGAIEDGIPVGAALWKLEMNRVRLLSIAVEGQRQRLGIATAILRYSMRVLHQLNCDGVYALVLPEEEAVAGLLKAFGMTSEAEESASFKITLGEIEKEKYFQGNSEHTIALKDVSQSTYNNFTNQYFSANPDLFEKELFEPDCSRFIVREQKLMAGIFVEKEENELSVAWLHSVSDKAEDLIYLLREAVKEAVKKYSKDTVITFTCYSEALLKIIQKLLGEKAERDAIQKWSMSDSAFRLAETSVSAWEKGE